MKFRPWYLVLIFALPLCCPAQLHCPWLNAATAAGLLNGGVQMTVKTLSSRGDAACEFTRGSGADAATLRVEVRTMTDPAKEFASLISSCGGQIEQLTAIGNQAVQCTLPPAAHTTHVKLIGRVRKRSFIIVVQSPSGDLANDDIRNLAEQVAGILF